MRTLSLLLFLLSAVVKSGAQELPRRAFLGIRMEAVTDDVQRIMNLPSAEGVLINQVFPGSSAAAAGWREGDILLQIGDEAVNSPAETVEAVAAFRGGEEAAYILFRQGRREQGRVTFLPLPVEQYADLEMKYASVTSPSGQHRAILTRRPDAGRQPAVLFMQGVGCYSLDSPFDTSRAETQLLNGLARRGYTVLRLEKSGVGDSRGASCHDISFMDEVAAFDAGLRWLREQPGVDSSRLFLFGHSMGGVMAPLVARQTSVRGIITYGSIGENFIEYLINSRKTIAESYQMAPHERDDFMKQACECAAYYFINDLPSEEIIRRDSACAGYINVFDDRSRAFWRELYELNIPQLWRNADTELLALWGEADFIAPREDQENLVRWQNFYHPGRGKFRVAPNLSHGMERAASFTEARTNPGGYDPELTNIILRWLREHA